jgi:hypothetical protein
LEAEGSQKQAEEGSRKRKCIKEVEEVSGKLSKRRKQKKKPDEGSR